MTIHYAPVNARDVLQTLFEKYYLERNYEGKQYKLRIGCPLPPDVCEELRSYMTNAAYIDGFYIYTFNHAGYWYACRLQA